MDLTLRDSVRTELLDRRHRLDGLIRQVGRADDLVQLLEQVDAALAGLEAPSAGLCRVCGLSILEHDLRAHPLLEYCLCELSERQQRELEHDLRMARRLQLALLPEQPFAAAGWEAHHRYVPAGAVSGDYCDLIRADGGVIAALGDVSGKGVAAAFLMAQLNGLLRSLAPEFPPLGDLVARANRFFLERAAGLHFATLLCARLGPDGAVEFCNAGHCPPLLIRNGRVSRIEPDGLPVGVAEADQYATQHARLQPGDCLVLYSDGVTETRNANGELFGEERLNRTLCAAHDRPPAQLIAACLAQLAAFQGHTAREDDLTIMVICRTDRS